MESKFYRNAHKGCPSIALGPHCSTMSPSSFSAALPVAGAIHCMCLIKEQSFRSSVRNAGCERGFNYPRSQSAVNVDEWMKQAEAEAGSLVVDIRRQGNLRNLTQSDREWLAAFVAIQMVHTRRQLTAQDDL